MEVVAAMERADIEAWRDAQLDRWAPDTINGRLRVLKTLLADSCAEARIPNPAARVKAVPRRGRGRSAPTIVADTNLVRCSNNRLTPHELARVLAAVREDSPQWFALLSTLALTGARFGEVTALRWSDVDLSSGVLRIERSQWRGHFGTTKTQDVRVLPVEPELARVLADHRRNLVQKQHPGLDSGLVFPSSIGRAIVCASSLRKPLAAAYRKVGLKRWVSPHGFRRSLNNAARQQASAIVVRSLTGHVTEEMTEHYSTVELSEKRAVVRSALGAVLRTLGEENGDIRETSQSETKNRRPRPKPQPAVIISES